MSSNFNSQDSKLNFEIYLDSIFLSPQVCILGHLSTIELGQIEFGPELIYLESTGRHLNMK